MDSLLANYASSDEEEQQQNQQQLQSRSIGSETLFSRLPPPKPTFNLPPPKSKSNKRLVQFRPPLKAAVAVEEEEEEEEKEPPPKKRIGESSGGLFALLPPPKNTQTLGGGGGSRRTILEPDATTAASAVTDVPAPASQEPQLEASCNVEATQQFVGQYDYNAYYYSEPTQQFVGQDDYNGYYYSAPDQVSTETVPPQVQLPLESKNKKGGRKAFEIGSDVIEIKQEQLMGNKPRQDQVNLTGIAFGPSYKPVSAAKDKPSKLQKRKHQIGSLYYDLKQKEMELAERRARGHLTKAETQAKYGW
ncbi:uncharacterized protein LOC131033285 [Cryptomeria japonica]|uniref:uncharacterized protein LOC131033285 n=1 Tax=Cryptomeria japonica TaxID=3369 RepID=UPI0027DA6A28|nr:uncharacterized protein LOC131033285 [Cryptomeria japonica]